MCHFCHVLGKNPQAPTHFGQNCLDKANTYSKVPMNKRIYENGVRIENSNSHTNSCVICLDQKPNMTFIPCGHVATCELCSSQVQSCPICRETIVNKQKLYFV